MEKIKAHKFLLKLSKEFRFSLLTKHLIKNGPIRIKLTKLNFVDHLARIIVGQQLSTKSADAIWSRVSLLLKQKNTIKNLNKSLLQAGLSKQKASYLMNLLDSNQINSMSRDDLIDMNHDEFRALLLIQKGIGPWSVDMSRIFYLGDTDILPFGDLGIQNAHKLIFPTQKFDESFYKIFSPYRSYLSLFMWNFLEGENQSI